MGNLLSFFVCIAERSASPAGAPVGTYPGAGDRRRQARRPRYGAECSPYISPLFSRLSGHLLNKTRAFFLLPKRHAGPPSACLGRHVSEAGRTSLRPQPSRSWRDNPGRYLHPLHGETRSSLLQHSPLPRGEGSGVRATLRRASLGPRSTPPSAPSTNTDPTSASVMSGLRSASTGSGSVRSAACLVPPTDAIGANVLPPDDPPQRAASSASGAGPISIAPDVSLCSRYVVAEPGVRVRWRRIVVV